jgi:carboxypeptidase D
MLISPFVLDQIDESDPSRILFWIFKPAMGKPVDEVTIWLNGGPGCSSLEGFLQENGPISWRPGQFHPSYNPFHWARLTNMIWVEQPVGTGFSQGKVTARNEYDIAKDFVGFFKNWQKLFGIKNFKIYMTVMSLSTRSK